MKNKRKADTTINQAAQQKQNIHLSVQTPPPGVKQRSSCFQIPPQAEKKRKRNTRVA